MEKNVVTALTLSGALSGLAGVVLVFGSESLRLVTDGGSAGFTGSAGFNGIVAALFGGLHPLWTIPSSFLFGSLLTGATELQRQLQIPNALAIALNGLVVLFVVSSDKARGLLNRRMDRTMTVEAELPGAPDPDEPPEVSGADTAEGTP